MGKAQLEIFHWLLEASWLLEANPNNMQCKRLIRTRCNSTSDRNEKTAGDRARTDDLRFTKPLLYQLSYAGTCGSHYIAFPQIATIDICGFVAQAFMSTGYHRRLRGNR